MDWKDGLPEELKSSEALKDIKDVAALAKVYVDTKAHVGNSLRIPGPDAGPEDKKAFYEKLHAKVPNVMYMPEKDDEKIALEGELWRRLGRPENAKDYSLEGVDLGGVQVNADSLKESAVKLGLTKKQFAELAKSIAAGQAEAERAMKADQDSVKKEWGAAYEDKLTLLSDTAKKLGAPEDVVAAIKQGRYAAKHLKVWEAVQKAVGGEGHEGREAPGTGAAGRLTPDEARARIEEMMNNREGPYWNKSSPFHQAKVEEMLKLQAALHFGEE